jgi:hypothetical protein
MVRQDIQPSFSLVDSLFNACREGDIEFLMKSFSASAFDVHRFSAMRDIEGRTMMDIAAEYKQAPIIEALLLRGWMIHDPTATLSRAVASGSVRAVNLLLTHISEVAILNQSVFDMLFSQAVSYGHSELVHLFVSQCPVLDIPSAVLIMRAITYRHRSVPALSS